MQSHVLIVNPETKMVDSTQLVVDRFTVQAVFEAMEEKGWHFQSGTFVALRVDGPRSHTLQGGYNSALTFTVEESERVVTERIAIPV